jgi:hypothetical protein
MSRTGIVDVPAAWGWLTTASREGPGAGNHSDTAAHPTIEAVATTVTIARAGKAARSSDLRRLAKAIRRDSYDQKPEFTGLRMPMTNTNDHCQTRKGQYPACNIVKG